MFLEIRNSFKLLPKRLSCVSQNTWKKKLKKNERMGYMNQIEGAVICCCKNVIGNCLILLAFSGVTLSM